MILDKKRKLIYNKEKVLRRKSMDEDTLTVETDEDERNTAAETPALDDEKPEKGVSI